MLNPFGKYLDSRVQDRISCQYAIITLNLSFPKAPGDPSSELLSYPILIRRGDTAFHPHLLTSHPPLPGPFFLPHYPLSLSKLAADTMHLGGEIRAEN